MRYNQRQIKNMAKRMMYALSGLNRSKGVQVLNRVSGHTGLSRHEVEKRIRQLAAS